MNHTILEIVIVPIITSILVSIIPLSREKEQKQVGLIGGLITWLLSLKMYYNYDKSNGNYQMIDDIGSGFIVLGVDGLSIVLIILTTLVTPLCILIGWTNVKKLVKEYIILFLLMESLIILVFSVLDIFWFYIFFESVLIPMYLIIGIWGARVEKEMAAYQFFMYTLIGSLLMLLSIIWLYTETGTTNYLILHKILKERPDIQMWMWLGFFISFGTKVPMIPVHLWLPQAHVEAPTGGSVILAGILLKLGTYGIIRYSLGLFPYASLYFSPLVFTISLIGIIYASLTTIRQIDLKRIIAYSSVAHMNFVTIGLFTFNIQGIQGAMTLMITHGLISSALFTAVGIIYDRYHTRLLPYYGGLTIILPIFSTTFLFFTFANISFPGTASFVGELLILLAIYKENAFVGFFATTGVVLGAVYSIWLANRILFGPYSDALTPAPDITLKEFVILTPLILGTLYIGIYPSHLLNTIYSSSILIVHSFQ